MKLVVENLQLERGSRTVIAGVSFSVASSEALLLTGANGAGKTTLLRALAGLLPAAAGTIRLEGGNAERDLAEQCAYFGHQNGLKSSFTATENLAFWASYLGSAGSDRVSLALTRLNLETLAAIPAGYLSAGQKRRLGLARLLVADRPVWLLDEPTVSLDAASTKQLGDIVNAHIAAGGIAVAATHLPLGLINARELRLGPPARDAAP